MLSLSGARQISGNNVRMSICINRERPTACVPCNQVAEVVLESRAADPL
jgi:hypothetical protein